VKAPRWVRKFQRQREWYKTAGEVLKIINEAQKGGPIGYALAGLNVFGQILDTMFPGESAWQLLRQQDYRDTDYSIGGFLCELMHRSKLPLTVLPVGLGSQIALWENDEVGIAAVYYGDEYGNGPYLREGDEAAFIKVIQDVIWSNGNDLMLSANKGDAFYWRGARKFRLSPMPDPGPYIGKKRPEDFAARLKRYGRGPRTVLLRGPTGIGKSVLARHIAKLMGGGTTRTLKIASSTLRNCRFDEDIALARFFQPTVLLLDDLDLSEKKNTEEFLTMLEALRAPDCLVIVTMMAGTDPDKKPEMGDWHFDGMRPGRIDETFTFYLPDKTDRDLILRHYYDRYGVPAVSRQRQTAIVKATDGLSGAYLGEVARRIQVHGIDEWKTEVQNVVLTAPKPGNGDEGDGKGDKPSPPDGEGKAMVTG